MWLGPPSRKHQITFLALVVKCGAFGSVGDSGGPAARADSSIRDNSASMPMPPPARVRKSRRDTGRSWWWNISADPFSPRLAGGVVHPRQAGGYLRQSTYKNSL